MKDIEKCKKVAVIAAQSIGDDAIKLVDLVFMNGKDAKGRYELWSRLNVLLDTPLGYRMIVGVDYSDECPFIGKEELYKGADGFLTAWVDERIDNKDSAVFNN